jgi:hypothetical protein
VKEKSAPEDAAPSRPAGALEDFCLEAPVPAKGDALTAGEVFSAYPAWCERLGFETMDEEAFAQASLALRIGLRSAEGRYRGIALASPHSAQRLSNVRRKAA